LSRARRVEFWVWVAIYLGLIALGLGLSIRRLGADWGWGVMFGGALLVVLGGVLIWVRSRMKPPA